MRGPDRVDRNLGLEAAIRQTFGSTGHPHAGRERGRWRIPYTFSTFDYRSLCELMWEQCGDAEFETAKVDGAERATWIHTDRGDVRGGADRGRARLAPRARQRHDPAARGDALARPGGPPERLRPRPAGCGSTRATCRRATAGRSPRARNCGIGIGSYDPRFHVKEPTVRLAQDGGRRHRPLPGQLDPPPASATPSRTACSSCGDSAGHCLAMSAEGIRTAWYFGIAVGRELTACRRGRAHARRGARALRRLR